MQNLTEERAQKVDFVYPAFYSGGVALYATPEMGLMLEEAGGWEALEGTPVCVVGARSCMAGGLAARGARGAARGRAAGGGAAPEAGCAPACAASEACNTAARARLAACCTAAWLPRTRMS